MEIVTVMTFTEPLQAAMVQGFLEAEGIDCVLLDANTAQVYNLISTALGGIRLQVAAEDAPRATEILRDGGFITDPVPANETFMSKVRLERAVVETVDGHELCPFCGGDQLAPPRISAKLFAWTYLLIGLPLLPMRSRERHCLDCGKRFVQIRGNKR